MSFTSWGENKVLNHLFSKATYSPGTLSIGLSNANPGEGATGGNCNEIPNSYGYARVSVPAATWATAVNGRITNALTITFPFASGNWGWVRFFVLVSSSTYGAGSVLLYSSLDSQRNIIAGSQFRFNPGALVILLD